MFSKAYYYLKNQPDGFFPLLVTETCELFGFFGLSSLLVLYMTNSMHIKDALAFTIYGSFSAFIYATPVLGGPIADKIIGYKNSIFIGIITMILGLLFITSPKIVFFYLGLGLFSVGSGFFTPSFNTLVSKLYHLHEEKRDNAFTMYHMSKNLGALFAIIICAYLSHVYGYIYAFYLSAAVMLIGLVFFTTLQKHISHYLAKDIKAKKSHLSAIMAGSLLVTGLTAFLLESQVTYIIMSLMTLLAIIFIIALYQKVSSEYKKNLKAIVVATLLFIVFGVFLGEGGTTLSLFIERIVDRQAFGTIIPPSTFYALDPLFMLLLGGFMMYGLGHLRQKSYTHLSLQKITLGLAILGVGFLVFTIAAQSFINTGIKPSLLYVVIAYALFPLSELCIVPIVLSMTTKLAPKGYEAMMVGFYLVGYALGSYFSGIFSIIGHVSPQSPLIQSATIYRNIFGLSAIILLLSALVTYAGIHYVARYRQEKEQLNKNRDCV